MTDTATPAPTVRMEIPVSTITVIPAIIALPAATIIPIELQTPLAASPEVIIPDVQAATALLDPAVSVAVDIEAEVAAQAAEVADDEREFLEFVNKSKQLHKLNRYEESIYSWHRACAPIYG